MRRIDRWFAAYADVKRWELVAWYSFILAAVAWPSIGASLIFALVATVLVVLGSSRWDDAEPYYDECDDDECRVCNWEPE